MSSQVWMTIEDIILDQDRRGVSALRPYLPRHFCTQAAAFILAHPGTVFLATGFYIVTAGAPETDGPPGAVVLGNALEALGYRVVYVSDKYCVPILRGLASPSARVEEFPITTPQESQAFAQRLLETYQPALLISTERCSLTRQGVYRNMRGVDITPYTARLDYLFLAHPASVGVGDGGNEIGMGKVAEIIPTVPTLPKDPAATPTTHLVIASVSNWGCYGLVGALSALVGRNLLPTPEEEMERIRATVRLGAVDGISGRPEPSVDSFPLEVHGQIVLRLHRLLEARGMPR
ncbi:MAG: DUF4392 domain-containing protein [Dehalococcoidia bacterium]|nr:DUF4392 domain-containing protein [Dehalococcoidia bacterium]MDW8119443.1 DUF4392 domain-containing protein [Chloroflexota bacterium]